MSDVWLPTWPGSEQTVLLAMANYMIQNDLYDVDFVRRWVNWEETLETIADGLLQISDESYWPKSKIVNQTVLRPV